MLLLYLAERNVVVRAQGPLPLMFKAGEVHTPCVDETVITMLLPYLVKSNVVVKARGSFYP